MGTLRLKSKVVTLIDLEPIPVRDTRLSPTTLRLEVHKACVDSSAYFCVVLQKETYQLIPRFKVSNDVIDEVEAWVGDHQFEYLSEQVFPSELEAVQNALTRIAWQFKLEVPRNLSNLV